jgi:putative membrane protein
MKGMILMSENQNQNRVEDSTSWGKIALRFILSAIVIAVASFITPGFEVRGLWGVILAALAITVIDYLIERFAKIDASPFGRGITGFIVAAIILYVTQFLVPGMNVTLLGALLASIVIGVIDFVVPGKTM